MEATGCNCPFSSLVPIDGTIPVIPSANATCTCKEGYSGNQCATPPPNVNTCGTNNGGCDYKVECTFNGTRSVCGSCPTGTVGSGATSCVCMQIFLLFYLTTDINSMLITAQCGDSICQASEDCVSCYADCGAQGGCSIFFIFIFYFLKYYNYI